MGLFPEFKGSSEFSLNGDAFCRFDRITRKQKSPAAKCYPQYKLNAGSLTLILCMLLSELIPYLLEFWKPLDPDIVILYWFQKKFQVQESMDNDYINI